MALSALTIRRILSASRAAASVVNAEVMYKGAFAAVGSPNHGTAANIGRVGAWDDTAGNIPFGLVISGGGSGASQGADSVTGDSTNAATLLDKQVALLLEDFVVDKINVTGASAATDLGRLVYLTDDDTVSLTRGTLGVPAGVILEYRASGTSCQVLFFGVPTMYAIMLSGGGRRIDLIACVCPNSTNLGTGLEMPCGGTINDVFAICMRAPTDADVDVDLNLEIDGTNVTGGLVELVAADTQGLKKAGTAITDNNTFFEGSLLDLEGTVNTAGTATDPGLYAVYIDYTIDPGL